MFDRQSLRDSSPKIRVAGSNGMEKMRKGIFKKNGVPRTGGSPLAAALRGALWQAAKAAGQKIKREKTQKLKCPQEAKAKVGVAPVARRAPVAIRAAQVPRGSGP